MSNLFGNRIDKDMTLPWLRRKQITGTSVVKMGDNGMEEMGEDDEGLRMAASDLLSAMKADDAAKVASALRAAFQICDSAPHEEGVHLDGEMK